MASQRDGGIAWCDETWNPVTGCSKVSPGCAHCYAETVAARFWPKQYQPIRETVEMKDSCGYPVKETLTRPRRFEDVMCHEDRLDQPLRWKRPRRIFVNSMSDLFHEDVPFEFVAAVFAVMAYCSWHMFQVLTKRAERMRAFLEWVNAPEGGCTLTEEYGAKAGQQITQLRFARVDHDIAMRFLDRTDEGIDLHACLHNGGVWPPPNVWLGPSIENQAMAERRFPIAAELGEAGWNVMVSMEPLLGAVAIPSRFLDLGARAWVIVGGESGTGSRPMDLAWARSIVAQCRASGVPVFVKQLGRRPMLVDAQNGNIGYRFLNDRKGGDPSEWPADLNVREFPDEVLACPPAREELF